MAQPVPIKAFLQPAKAAPMCMVPCAGTRPPPYIQLFCQCKTYLQTQIWYGLQTPNPFDQLRKDLGSDLAQICIKYLSAEVIVVGGKNATLANQHMSFSCALINARHIPLYKQLRGIKELEAVPILIISEDVSNTAIFSVYCTVTPHVSNFQ